MPPKKATQQAVELPPMDIREVLLRVIGDTSLISHKWSDKAKRQMLEKQMKKARPSGKEAKDPWMDFCHSLYWLTPMPEYPTQDDVAKARFGMPTVAFKGAAVNACSHTGKDITKVLARGAFHIDGEMVTINGTPEIREDMVRIAMGTADIRYRGEFKKWSADVTIRYNASVLSADQIVNLFNIAGFAIGIGEWRPQTNGSYGMFHVARQGE